MAVALAVLVTILKICLILLGILLFLVLFILFCPIHYRAYWERSFTAPEEEPSENPLGRQSGPAQKEKETILLKGAVRWLFFLIYCPFSYEEGGLQFQIRICGIRLRRGRERRSRRRKGRNTENTTAVENIPAAPEDPGLLKKPESSAELQAMEEADVPESGQTNQEQQDKTEKQRKKKHGSTKTSRRRKDAPRFRGIWEKLREKSDLASDVRTFWKEENTKQMVCILKENVIQLLKKLKPKVLRGSIEFGTGDPCQTGLVLGGIACLYAYYGEAVEIIPDFMEKKFCGYLFVKGRISLITLVIILLRIVLRKGFSRFIKDMKGLKEALS